MATIGLAMIVKDEAQVIERCLDSVKTLCDHVIIVDTGSSDGTQDVVRAWLARNGMPGEVCDIPWRDFAYNRTMALARMRQERHIDYCLMIDADEQLFYDQGFNAAAFKEGLQADIVNITTHHHSISYLRPQLFRNALEFTFRGVLHEFLEAPAPGLPTAMAQGLANHPSPDGARSRNPNKYADDARLLCQALAAEDDPFLKVRYQFYLGQSLRDAGLMEEAIEAYNKRTTMGGWAEEIFVSYYQIGKLGERLDYPQDEVIAAYLHAHETVPHRAEALVAAAAFCRGRERHALAYLFAKRALDLSPCTDALFAEPDAYAYRAKDEAAVAAYWIGHYRESRDLCDELLAGDALPDAERARVSRNRAFAAEQLAPELVETQA